jgi:hypothetical protein
MNKISAHQCLIRLIFLHDTDPISCQEIALWFACQLGLKASTLQPGNHRSLLNTLLTGYGLEVPPFITSFSSWRLAINCHTNLAANRMNFFVILRKWQESAIFQYYGRLTSHCIWVLLHLPEHLELQWSLNGTHISYKGVHIGLGYLISQPSYSQTLSIISSVKVDPRWALFVGCADLPPTVRRRLLPGIRNYGFHHLIGIRLVTRSPMKLPKLPWKKGVPDCHRGVQSPGSWWVRLTFIKIKLKDIVGFLAGAWKSAEDFGGEGGHMLTIPALSTWSLLGKSENRGCS